MKMSGENRIGPEFPFFFPNDGCRLFGILHGPDIAPNGRGVVMCYPFGEERLWAQRVMVKFARILAGKGYSVLRFDYRGNGDSEGNFEDSTVETNLSDIFCAVNWMKREIPGIRQVDLLGLRFGATLAMLAAEKNVDASRLVLWEPVINGKNYINELLRINLVTQMAAYNRILHDRNCLIEILKEGKTVNVDGYEILWTMYEQMLAIDLNKTISRNPRSCLLVQIDDRTKEARPVYRDIIGNFAVGKISSVVEDPFWKEIKVYYGAASNLFDETLGWIEAP